MIRLNDHSQVLGIWFRSDGGMDVLAAAVVDPRNPELVIVSGRLRVYRDDKAFGSSDIKQPFTIGLPRLDRSVSAIASLLLALVPDGDSFAFPGGTGAEAAAWLADQPFAHLKEMSVK